MIEKSVSNTDVILTVTRGSEHAWEIPESAWIQS